MVSFKMKSIATDSIEDFSVLKPIPPVFTLSFTEALLSFSMAFFYCI